jgi:hypothetical protein
MGNTAATEGERKTLAKKVAAITAEVYPTIPIEKLRWREDMVECSRPPLCSNNNNKNKRSAAVVTLEQGTKRTIRSKKE